MFEKRLMQMFYDKAATPGDLPWHQDEPPALLLDAAEQTGEPKTALDLGCGAGTYSIALAKMGFTVTGIDFIPKALEFARRQAARAGVELELVAADILDWQPERQFSLVLDSGTLHTFTGRSVTQYRRQLMSWLAAGGSYVLGHWGKRGALDWRPIGPRRRSRETLVRLFAPELTERAWSTTEIRDVPMPLGPTVLGQGIWFERVR